MSILPSTETMNRAAKLDVRTNLPSRAQSLVELLTRRAEVMGHRLAYEFQGEGFQAEAGNGQTMTFAELDARARAIGAKLSDELSPGDRVLLVFPAGLDFIASFFGCLYAGMVAVPATYPKPKRPLARMSRIAADSGATLALTTSQTLNAIDFDQQDDTVRQLNWLAADETTDAPDDWQPVDAVPTDLAFLQYTSGSTSEPKGVMISHGNLLANLEAIRVAFGLPVETVEGDGECGVFWLPAYHDMGLIGGVLTPLYVGGPSILMPPTSFLQRPLRWLETISQIKATISGAPNFAYELCVERTTEAERAALDLSNWRLAFCGAEPVHAGTLSCFAEAFETAGFRPNSYYPCYGLAEATLLAAGPEGDEPPTLLSIDREALRSGKVQMADGGEHSQTLVGCGIAPRGHRVEIVSSETISSCGEDTVGEILVQGPSVAQGYWNRPDATASTFNQTVADCEGTFMRTGDLGFRHRGELFVTGRVKDVIILRGSNHYPQDIEQTALDAHPAVMMGAAFSIEQEDEERLVVVHQLDRSCRDEDEREQVAEAIRRAILTEHEVDPWAVVLIRPASLPITSSGKVQRHACRDQFLAGELKVQHQWQRQAANRDDLPPAPSLEGLAVEPAAERIGDWMRTWLIEKAEINAEDINPSQPFADLGLDSLTAVELSSDLESAFNVPLPPVVAWNYPTPEALARYLAGQALGIEEAEEPASPPEANDADLDALLGDIEGMSDEEVARLLAEE